MKQNLANRLAGGGYWAIVMATQAVQNARYMREHDLPLPPQLSVPEPNLMELCGAEVFRVFLNANITGAQIGLDIQQPVQLLPKFDRQCRPIPHDAWEQMQKLSGYRDVAKWVDDEHRTYVSTVWVGYDKNGCQPPHLFKTYIVRFEGVKPRIEREFDSHNLPEAAAAHHEVVSLVKAGKL